jgi:hypothetical protein
VEALQVPKPVHEDDKKSTWLCNQRVESGIVKNLSIQFLLKTLVDSGCMLPDNFIHCMKCKQPTAGGFGMVMEEMVINNYNGSSSNTLGPNSSINSKEQCHRMMQDLQEQIKCENDEHPSFESNQKSLFVNKYILLLAYSQPSSRVCAM